MEDYTNIDFSFIEQLEGFTLIGYVPDAQSSQSGVTIGSGFDIGQRSVLELKNAFSASLFEKLKPYATLKKMDAVIKLAALPLTISTVEAQEITRYSHSSTINRIANEWNASRSKIPFEQLHCICATVMCSVAFQYGSLSKPTPKFWQQVTTEDWQGALSNLRHFGDNYPTRRNKEADLLQSWLEASV
ncbi:pesticin C-terminus-like muramidase [uncultured Shewanella sp.]|uniref:pesticin C-terminus-like muramidase n=1 Tax=uncultured Shewanella sp. TaxID=173975 RepID=UPI00262CDE13|nr:pesticin C-terminus-like muramidase [uncultured Shewanella sp.]